jgi:hypothetical protein
MPSNKMFIGCGIAVIVVLVLAIAGVLLGPLLIADVPVNIGQSDDIQVFIQQPANGSSLALNQPVGVYSEAVGLATINTLELWVDDQLWQTGASTSSAGKIISANWIWTPVTEGWHRLMVRATFTDGRASNSNLVELKIVSADTLPTPEPLAQNQIPPLNTPDAADLKPPEGGIPAGEPPEIPPPPVPPVEDPPPVDDNKSPGSNWIPIKYDLWLQNLLGQNELPEAPKIWATLKDCDVTLTIKDNSEIESGFVVNRVGPGGTAFAQIAKLDKRVGTGTFKYVDTGIGFGKYVYAVYAVNAAGSAMSNLVSVNSTNNSCLQKEQTSLGLTDAKLKPSISVFKLYCYMSVDSGDWTRIPPGDNNFIYGTNGEFDLSPYLGNLIINPPPQGVTLELDCWGWDGGTLIHLGKSKQQIDSGNVEINSDLFAIKALANQGFWMIHPGGDPPPNKKIAPPYNFHFIQNTSECNGFMQALCKLMLDNGNLIVMWDWNPQQTCLCKQNEPCVCTGYNVTDIDGFNIYSILGGNPPVKISSYLSIGRIGFVKPLAVQGIIHPEFYARAYKDNLESADSNRVSQMELPGTNIKIIGRKEQVRWHTSDESSWENHGWQVSVWTTDHPVRVGYESYYYNPGMGMSENNRNREEANIIYDLSQVKGPIIEARMYFKEVGSIATEAGVSILNKGCMNTMASNAGTAVAMYGPYTTLADYSLWGEKGYDVTIPVRGRQLLGEKYVGVTLQSGVKLPAQAHNNRCFIDYDDFYLNVKYLPL